VGDELVAGATQLVSVAVAGEIEGARQRGTVDRRDRDRSTATVGAGIVLGSGIELLDYGKEIGEELPLL